MLVTFYETARGDRPVEEFIDRLSSKEAAKVLDALASIEAHGFDAVVTRQLKGKLWELKVSASRIPKGVGDGSAEEEDSWPVHRGAPCS